MGPGSRALLRTVLSSSQPLESLKISAIPRSGLAAEAGQLLADLLWNGAKWAHGRAAPGLRKLTLQVWAWPWFTHAFCLMFLACFYPAPALHEHSVLMFQSPQAPQLYAPTHNPHHRMQMQGVQVQAVTATLLPKAFPNLRALHLLRCKQTMLHLLGALRNWRYLHSLTIAEPYHLDMGALLDAARRHLEDTRGGDAVPPIPAEGAPGSYDLRTAFMVGLLLRKLPQLTRLSLRMSAALLAVCYVNHEGPWGNAEKRGPCLQWLNVSEVGLVADPHNASLAPLQAWRGLRHLSLSTRLAPQAMASFASSPALRGLLSLHVPTQAVGQGGLDAILQGLPGEGGPGGEGVGELANASVAFHCHDCAPWTVHAKLRAKQQ